MTRGVLLDLAGVIYDGGTAIPGGVDAVTRLRRAGLSIRFVSNTTRSSKQRVLDHLAAIGLIGEVLAEHFPRDAADRNEIPDKLIEL